MAAHRAAAAAAEEAAQRSARREEAGRPALGVGYVWRSRRRGAGFIYGFGGRGGLTALQLTEEAIVGDALEEAGVGAGEEILKRSAGGPESAGRLERLAEESLANAEEQVHGISVTAGTPRYAPFKEVPRSVVEKVFRVHDTPLAHDPLHRTVELPHR